MTETQIKKMKGIYEQDTRIWQRWYKFETWKETFEFLEERTIECYRLVDCSLTDEGKYDFISACNPREDLSDIYVFNRICKGDRRDYYSKLEEIGYWSMRYEMMLEDLIYYFHIQLVNYAHIDKYDYPGLIGTEFETPEIRAQYFYLHNKPEGYKVDFPSPEYFRILMRVDPCVGKSSATCCQESAQDVCEDNTTIISGKDVPIAWFVGGFIVQCSSEYSKRGQCGTYIEIHRPNNPKIEEAI